MHLFDLKISKKDVLKPAKPFPDQPGTLQNRVWSVQELKKNRDKSQHSPKMAKKTARKRPRAKNVPT